MDLEVDLNLRDATLKMHEWYASRAPAQFYNQLSHFLRVFRVRVEQDGDDCDGLERVKLQEPSDDMKTASHEQTDLGEARYGCPEEAAGNFAGFVNSEGDVTDEHSVCQE